MPPRPKILVPFECREHEKQLQKARNEKQARIMAVNRAKQTALSVNHDATVKPSSPTSTSSASSIAKPLTSQQARRKRGRPRKYQELTAPGERPQPREMTTNLHDLDRLDNPSTQHAYTSASSTTPSLISIIINFLNRLLSFLAFFYPTHNKPPTDRNESTNHPSSQLRSIGRQYRVLLPHPQ